MQSLCDEYHNPTLKKVGRDIEKPLEQMKMIDTGTIVTKMIEKALEKQSSYWLSPAEDTIYDDTTMQL